MPVSMDDGDITRYLQRMPQRVFVGAKAVFRDAVFNVQREVAGNFGGGINTVTGALKRSLRATVKGTTIQSLSGKVESKGVPYAHIQEYGGIIKAKRAYMGLQGAPFLNIPLKENRTAAGAMRKSARAVFSEGGYTIKSRRGKYLVMSAAGVPMFVLVKQVKLQPKLGLRKARDNEIEPMLSRLDRVMTGAIE